MTDEPTSGQESASSGSGGGSGPFSGTTGWVVGLTGLVGAVAALAKVFGFGVDSQPREPVAVAATAAPDAAAAATDNAAEDASAPMLYKGEMLKLEWFTDPDLWTFTNADGEADYEEIATSSEIYTLAYNKSLNQYLRWPTAGGDLESSDDDKASWVPIGRVDPAPTE
ncbi:hypothetical protein [Sphingomonas sp.]|uniref:hypothetical protein n=1 Tax=Sphingomonas sp. TaxID=28214 RepID=UPI00286A9A02|nr:hypothetical protein [Sphingomonas sp.]